MITRMACATTMMAFFLASLRAVAAPFHDVPVIEGLEVTVVADRRPGALDQDGTAGAGCLCGAVSRGGACPADSWLPGHIPAQEARCAASGKYARTSAPISEMTPAAASEPMPGMVLSRSLAARKGSIISSICASSLREHGFQVVDVVQVQPAQEGMMLTEPAFQGHRQVRDLRPHPAVRQLREDRRAALPVDERLDHRPPGLGGDRGRDRVDLDPGVLQHVPEPLQLRGPRLG